MFKTSRVVQLAMAATSALACAGMTAVPARAVTAAQNTAADLKAKADTAARLKAATELRTKTDQLAKTQAATTTRIKAQAIGNLSAHNEIKRRLEATRSAAAIHARIMAAHPGVAASTPASIGPAAGTSGRQPQSALPARKLAAKSLKQAIK